MSAEKLSSKEIDVKQLLEKKKYVIAVVSHTHWDRAWYLPFEKFRMRLVDVMDDVLRVLEEKDNFKKFVFDAQTVVLEDYLAIKPNKRAQIEKFVREGRLLVGPFYMLPDEFLVSGEVLIRNLLVGKKMAEEFGHSMNAGYIPDPFGHVTQIPQILNGFDIDSFIFMRGMGPEAEELGLEFCWVGPDKESKVLAIHQAGTYGNARAFGCERKGYEVYDYKNLKACKYSKKQGLKDANKQIEFLNKFPHNNLLLFNNGIDHYRPQEEVGDLIEYLNKKMDDCHFIHCSFEDYVNYLKQVNPDLKELHGEIREGRYQWLLTGVLSARIYLKQSNDFCQKMMADYVEPLSSFAYLEGYEYPAEMIEYGWKKTYEEPSSR